MSAPAALSRPQGGFVRGPAALALLLLAVAGALVWSKAKEQRAPSPPESGTASPGIAGLPAASAVCALPRLPASDAPVQRDGGALPAPFPIDQHRLTPRAAFAVQATVLGTERYRFDRGAALSPVDFALGWGRMADPAVHGPLAIRQSGRWYHYRWGPEGPPIPLPEIIRSSSNLHLIPADKAVERALLRIGAGQRVRLAGWLVDVDGEDGFVWRTSLSREDSGDGACEIVYVCEVATLP
ncbi:hypothetical protein [Silanimonas lenta]|uniref:hypothetical protein n=1 Tax=Silanimonas lenta TaxID=265429 RepID=UPI0004135472|nr:hypothetical protein [Silanimonas lenta]